uniref:SPOR domain-containing protein n=1 Tax=Orrella sp. TaxID=1921583 RepID=UPI004048A9AC
MAKQNRTSTGSTFYGVIAGLLIGLSAAAAVAYFVMNSPMPFVDKASRSAADSPMDPKQSPDPNVGLVPSTGGKPAQQDQLGQLIATLPATPKAVPPLPPPPAPKAPVASATTVAPSGDNKTYFLQVGAFSVLEDAESVRAQMILLGLPTQIQRAEVNGLQVNRVRVGPYERLDDMNKARARLAQEKITANVIRQ